MVSKAVAILHYSTYIDYLGIFFYSTDLNFDYYYLCSFLEKYIYIYTSTLPLKGEVKGRVIKTKELREGEKDKGKVSGVAKSLQARSPVIKGETRKMAVRVLP